LQRNHRLDQKKATKQIQEKKGIQHPPVETFTKAAFEGTAGKKNCKAGTQDQESNETNGIYSMGTKA
jgi:hypothetical protein